MRSLHRHRLKPSSCGGLRAGARSSSSGGGLPEHLAAVRRAVRTRAVTSRTTCEQPAASAAWPAAAHNPAAGTQPTQYAGSGGREQLDGMLCFCFLALGSYPNNAFVAI